MTRIEQASKQRPLLEVCIASVEDATVAEANGADRLELNAALALGGLTPSQGTLIETLQAVHVPVIAMVRPRPGGFAYHEKEFRVMLRDAELALKHGASGVAFGMLDADHRIDLARCAELLRVIGGRGAAVFHRAFDFTPDPFVAMEQLIDLGVSRVLTSGQQPRALNGAALIAELVARAEGRIEVLPAAGIRPHNVADLLRRTGCRQVHASLREQRQGAGQGAPDRFSLSAAPGVDALDGTSGRLVSEMVQSLRSLEL